MPPNLIEDEGDRRDGSSRSARITSIQADHSEKDFVIASTSLALSPTDSLVVSMTVLDRPRSERSRMFLESLMETCAAAIHKWLIYSDSWHADADEARSKLALVEAELVASELSHVAKNRLTAIQNIVYLLRKRTPKGSTGEGVWEYLDQLEIEVAETAEQLLHAQSGLSQGDALIGDVVRNAIGRAVALTDVAIDIVVDPPSLRLKGPSFNFDTVISNLVRNAADSVSGSGMKEPRVAVRISELFDDYYRSCEIEVHDNGPGVPLEVVSNIFSGISTKGPGHSGQGLRNVLRAVNAVGGKVSLPERSDLLDGALFKVVYPLGFSAEG